VQGQEPADLLAVAPAGRRPQHLDHLRHEELAQAAAMTCRRWKDPWESPTRSNLPLLVT
jgi:hypothetical protein